MNYNTIVIMFGLNPNNFKPTISNFIEVDNCTIFAIEQRTDIKRTCPFCNSSKLVIKDYDIVTYNSTTNPEQKIKLRIKKVRYKCKECFKTFTPKLDNIDVNSHIPNHIKEIIIKEFFNIISFADISKRYSISNTSVFNIFDEAFPNVERSTMPRILCIDEFHFSKEYDQNYCCVIVDLESKKVVDVLRNRKKEYLAEYFNSIPFLERNKVEYFISDMYDEYFIVKKKFFPNAIHIVDRFHVVTQLKVAISKIRVKVMNSQKKVNEVYYNFMKKNWRYYEGKRSSIPDFYYKNKKTGYIYHHEELFYATLKLDPDLNLANEVLQDIIYKLKFINDNSLNNFIMRFSQRLIDSNNEELKKVGRTYLKWIDGITNAYTMYAIDHKLSNGIAENINNHIKTIIKISYGLNDFPRMRKRVILISRKHK